MKRSGPDKSENDNSEDENLKPSKRSRVDEVQQLLNSSASNEEIFKKLGQMVAENAISLADLAYQMPEGPHKGTSALWWLTYGVASELPQISFAGILQRLGPDYTTDFLTMWDKLNDEEVFQLLPALMAPVTDGLHKGKSALWFLSNKPEVFLSVWNKIQAVKGADASQLLNALSMQVTEQRNFDLSALTKLVNNLKTFLPVFNKFKDTHGEQLSAALLAPSFEGASGILAISQQADTWSEKAYVNAILKALVTELPGLIPKAEAKELIYLRNATPELIEARNKFSTYLKVVSDKKVTQKALDSLFELAEEAQTKGYVNAFYDLGVWLERKDEHVSVLAAYAKMTKASPHYGQKASLCASGYFGQATACMEKEERQSRNQYLFSALQWALEIENEEDRLQIIRKIAAFYILDSSLGNESVVPDRVLLLMQKGANVDFYFEHFDLIKENLALKKTNAPILPSFNSILTTDVNLEAESKRTKKYPKI